MTQLPARDPLTLILRLTTLVVLIWIALGIGNLGTPPDLPPTQSPQLDRTLAALDRTLAQLASTRLHSAPATATSPDSRHPTAPGLPRQPASATPTPALHRTELPAPAAATASDPGNGALFDLGQQTPAKTAAAALRDYHDRFTTATGDTRRETRRELILMDRTAILRRFGRPDTIHDSQSGASEHWNYRVGDRNLSITIRNGYVTSIN